MTGQKLPLKLRKIWEIRTRLTSLWAGAVTAIVPRVITPIRDTRKASCPKLDQSRRK